MGIVKKLADGKYQVTVYDESGKRHRPKFIRKTEADAYVSKIESKKNEKKLIRVKLIKSNANIFSALDEFEAVKKENIRSGSFRRYKFILNQFRLFLVALRINNLDEFTPDHASILFRELTKERKDPTNNTEWILKAKPATVNLFLQLIRSFFESQVMKDKLLKNPMNHINYLKEEKKNPEFYTLDELDKFFSATMGDHLQEAFLGLLHTGCRMEELANLTWSDIDLQSKTLYIRSKGEFKTKTFNSERTIPMNNTLFELISKMREIKRNDVYVFSSKEGHKLRERQLLDDCKRIGKLAGITSRLFLHKFRHTFATHLVQKGVRLEVIQKLLGHSSYKETMIYAHVQPEYFHQDVSILDSLVFNKKEEDEKIEPEKAKPEPMIFLLPHLNTLNDMINENEFSKSYNALQLAA
jgi:site-specific recombinase XerD